MPFKVEPRGTSWQATVNQKGRFRRSFKTENEARAWALETEAKILKGETPDLGDKARRDPTKPHTVGELADYVIANRWAGTRSEKSQRINALSIVRWIGKDTPIASLDKMAIDTLKRKLKATGIADGTVNRKMATLSVMLNEALEMEIVSKRPKWKREKEVGGRDQRISTEQERQIDAFLRRLGEHDVADLWTFAIDTGLRLNECRKIAFSHVTDRALTVPASIAKGKKARTVPLTARAKALLERRRASQERVGRVFPSISDERFYDLLDAIRVHLGFEHGTPEWDGFVFHLTRHEFCSRLADRGVPAQTIQMLAGHASLTTSQRYIKVSPYAAMAAMKLLERSLEDVLGVADGDDTGMPLPASIANVDIKAA